MFYYSHYTPAQPLLHHCPNLFKRAVLLSNIIFIFIILIINMVNIINFFIIVIYFAWFLVSVRQKSSCLSCPSAVCRYCC